MKLVQYHREAKTSLKENTSNGMDLCIDDKPVFSINPASEYSHDVIILLPADSTIKVYKSTEMVTGNKPLVPELV